MRLSPLTAVLGLALGGTGALAHEVKHGEIAIVHPWVMATVVPSANAVVSFKIRNGGKHDDQLVSASSPLAPHAELVDVQNSHLNRVEVKADGVLVLGSDGPHIVLRGLTKPLSAYDRFPMTLTFTRAGKVTVEVMVEEAAEEPGNPF